MNDCFHIVAFGFILPAGSMGALEHVRSHSQLPGRGHAIDCREGRVQGEKSFALLSRQQSIHPTE